MLYKRKHKLHNFTRCKLFEIKSKVVKKHVTDIKEPVQTKYKTESC